LLNLLYPCQCSRKDIFERQADHGVYDGHCLNHSVNQRNVTSLRLKIPQTTVSFIDAIQGRTEQELAKHVGDFVMFRKDQIYAYHLAVILDDNAQGITEILRGYDLLDSTYQQIHLQRLLKVHTPHYAHIPVINGADGAKLSKQTFADDVSFLPIGQTLVRVFEHLHLKPPTELNESSPNEILKWGINNWSLKRIPSKTCMSLRH
ncbi:MAG: glutamate--tRNA ligase family protein, partial [Methylococcales bacterium]